MCGIFGLFISDNYYLQKCSLKKIISDFFIFSSTRGREAGFTEDDDMLSNMIRSKQITREEALIKSKDFSKPKSKSLKEYSRMIGFNFEDTLNKINRAKKLY